MPEPSAATPESVVAHSNALTPHQVPSKGPTSGSHERDYISLESDGLNCPVCYEGYTSFGERTPLAMTCGHSCCKSCVAHPRLKSCPVCRLSLHGVSKNFALASIVGNALERRVEIPDYMFSKEQCDLICKVEDEQNKLFELRLEMCTTEAMLESLEEQIKNTQSLLKHKEDRLNESKIEVANFEKHIDVEQKALLENRQNLQTAKYHNICRGDDTSNKLFPSMKSQESMFQDICKTTKGFHPHHLKKGEKFMLPSSMHGGSTPPCISLNINKTSKLAASAFNAASTTITSTA